MARLLKEVLSPELIKLHLTGQDKESIIKELVDVLAEAGMLGDPEEALAAVLEREHSLSTGMERGVAIPHAKIDSVERLLVAVGLKPEGVDFECADGQPARVFFLTLSPAKRSGPHIQFLAEISRLLRHDEARQKLLTAGSKEDVIAVLTNGKQG